MNAITGPIAPYSNVPIQTGYYEPREFTISDITRGSTTVVTTSSNHDYVVGQQIRLLIPTLYGAPQLNRATGYVIAVPATNQVRVDINSSQANDFVTSPTTATITGASKAAQCVITAANSFVIFQHVTISDVSGMTQLNGNTYQVVAANSTTFTLNVDTINFSTYTSGGTATLYTTYNTLPQIIPIGDINSGVSSNSDINSLTTYISGSFTNIS